MKKYFFFVLGQIPGRERVRRRDHRQPDPRPPEDSARGRRPLHLRRVQPGG